jgi:hypothetical protein
LLQSLQINFTEAFLLEGGSNPLVIPSYLSPVCWLIQNVTLITSVLIGLGNSVFSASHEKLISKISGLVIFLTKSFSIVRCVCVCVCALLSFCDIYVLYALYDISLFPHLPFSLDYQLHKLCSISLLRSQFLKIYHWLFFEFSLIWDRFFQKDTLYCNSNKYSLGPKSGLICYRKWPPHTQYVGFFVLFARYTT